jgi:hypothetical protein
MRSVRRFVLSLCFILLTYTGAQTAEPVPFVRVQAEESGLTHVVKQRTKEDPTAMVTWISATASLVERAGDSAMMISARDSPFSIRKVSAA